MDNQNNPAEDKGQRTTDIKSEVDIPRQWFDRGEAIKIIRYYFQCGEKPIRIATGFFYCTWIQYDSGVRPWQANVYIGRP